MDDLDRLFRRVVHNVRAAYPELLTQPFEVSQLYQQIVPYRLNRRELGVETVEEYELALMQLLAGARGYLTGDADMQRALQDDLDSSNPDLSGYRAYATSHVALAPDAVRAIEQQPLTPAGARVGAAARADATVASRATERIAASGASPTGSRPVAPKPSAAASAPPPSSPPRSPSASRPAAMAPKSAPPPTPPATPAIPTPRAASGGGDAVAASVCRYCGGSLPEGKSIVFCPYCGHDLTVQHCPACNTELEIGWRFCITCGRQVS